MTGWARPCKNGPLDERRSRVDGALPRLLRGGALCVLVTLSGCSGPVPLAAPALEIDATGVPTGSPFDATLTFFVLPNARFDEDYSVFMHFLSDDGELLWATDHYPPTPTSAWQPSSTVEYTRPILVPLCPYIGNTHVLIGLYSVEGGARLPLEGDDNGARAYRVGQLGLLPPAGNTRFSYRSGWHPLEYDSTCVRWRWSRQVGLIAFDNPRSDALLYLHLSHWGPPDEPRTLSVSVGDRLADRFDLARGDVVHQIPLGAFLLGDTDEVELRLEVDRTFVPAELPGSDTPDTRVLGVRVLGAYLQVQ